ncbi:phosphatidate cytidylyltransferase-like protein [Trypanosoma rangeli]|uniref:Phosphatidate cytidylyltransferase-like protein n=1 Tax=Trypanosoma rangeli TaxID=5698 RepID=A0A422NZP0_TRYRA|nr:phosphatidate cytidylyltransferase-like protein [Trypanosoma rangeli]RNF10963.1 phosphatidate cytidylyltransferase-like protein [Trypanosoma rangeli]|eukprot:RNF10963.1 phosphatidate cytidylyltransferase-like protein [Trypanosoma rangeli]
MTLYKVRIVSTNIYTMKRDTNLFIRATTIAFVGPTAVALAAYSKYTCALLIWCFFFFGMLEWSGIKRHIKVALLRDNGQGINDVVHEDLPKEYAAPVAPHNTLIITKTLVSSLIIVAACMGVDGFLLFGAFYFLGLTIFTLCGQCRIDLGSFICRQTMNDLVTQAKLNEQAVLCPDRSVNIVRSLFLKEELRVMDEKQTSELLLNLCLEYFGFVWIAGVVYPILAYDIDDSGRPWILAALVSNFSVDIVAMLVGRSMKGMTHPLREAISPKKSIEGAVLGVIAGAGVFVLLLHLARGGGTLAQSWGLSLLYLIVGVLLGVMGVMGDLLQSLLKRTARVKDSGHLMPGHGGVLDRIDGLLVVFPTMYCCMRVIELLY